MIQAVCDRCGRGGAPSTYTIVTIEVKQTIGPSYKKEKHFCKDPDGGTVGCDRIALAKLEELFEATIERR